MTVAIGLVCKDGVLVAADSMGSDQSIARASRKVNTLEQAPAIWTASGSVYVMEEVTPELAKVARNPSTGQPLGCLTSPDLPALRAQLKKAVHAGMKGAYQSALGSSPFPAGGIAPSFVTDFLMLGYANDQAWFLEFARDGQVNWHTESGYYAAGSGGPFASVALALMQHYIKTDLTLEDGKLLAYRTIQTTIDVSSGGVGPPVQIAICDGSGAKVLQPDELRAISDSVERWKELEADSLTLLRTGQILTTSSDELPLLQGDDPEKM